ncbi:DUF2336 domain-containing protein [Prosthecomicrobium sp. N25]|uniref:DUF2336 domain-containing protein n=1 Tax=Prosthecomicrobium sp. N25 TaxID=3129254 RepID=UPI003077035B
MFPSEGFLRFSSLGQADRSSTLLRALADLFLSHPAHRRDDLALFEELYLSISADAPEADRAEVAARLAGRPDLPVRVAAAIGLDVPAVAGRFVGTSPALAPVDLVRIVGRSGPEIRALVAGRPGLDGSVVEALIHTGDVEVLARLLDNRGVVLEPGAVQALRREAGSPEILRRLARRPEAPADLAMAAFLDLDADGRAIALRTAAAEAARGRLKARPRPPNEPPSGFEARAHKLLAARDHAGFEALVAEALALPAPLAARVCADPTGEALAVGLAALALEPAAATGLLILADRAASRSYWQTRALTLLIGSLDADTAGVLLDHWRGRPARKGTALRQLQDTGEPEARQRAPRRAAMRDRKSGRG